MKKSLLLVILSLSLTACDFSNFGPAKKGGGTHHDVSLMIKCANGLNVKNHGTELLMGSYETIGIVIAIFLASCISSVSEYGSTKAFDKLQEEASKIKSKVQRNNQTQEIDLNDIVVDDIIFLESGDQIPADGILLEGSLQVNEATLNGEIKEIDKQKNSPLYRSTVVYAGAGTMIVQKVGDNTLYGTLANEIKEKNPPSPLKLRLTHLAKQISKIGYLGAVLVTFSYLFSVVVIDNHFNIDLIKNTLTNYPLMFTYLLHALTLTVTIIVVAVPDSLFFL